MSLLRNSLWRVLLRALIAALFAVGFGLPLLLGAGAGHLAGQYVLLCAAAALGLVSAQALLGRLHRALFPLAMLTLIAVQGALLLSGRGFFRQTLTLLRALAMLMQDLPLALSLYNDVLCSQLAVWMTLLCFFLTARDTGVMPPLLLSTIVLTLQWEAGLQRESFYMLPVLPALFLVYALAHSDEADLLYNTRSSVSPALLPLAAGLLAISLLLSPAEGTAYEPLAQLAERLRDAINDRFFFQQERTRYTLESDGWMPQGESRLGGPPDPSSALVMQVSAPETVYLRGAILDTYTGAAWYDSISAQRYYWQSARTRSLRDEITQTAYPLSGNFAEQSVQIQMQSASSSTLFTPQRIRELQTGEGMTPYFNAGSEVFITRNLQPGDRYGVRFLSMKATDPGMAALAEQNARLTDPAFSALPAAYLALPSHIQQEIYDIAYTATAGCATPWQKAVALRDYLQTHYTYSLDVEYPPQDVDFAAWFLLAERKGYCTYFATAMTVLCRIAGLPARYVEGYVARPGPDGMAQVHGTDAHAWTEVYLSGLGWIAFDATPGRNEPDQSGSSIPEPPPQPPSAPPSPSPSPAPSPSPSDTPGAEATPTPPDGPMPSDAPTPSVQPSEAPDKPDRPSSPRLPWLWLLLLLLLVPLLAWRIRVTGPLYRAGIAPDDNAALALLWPAILECAALLKAPCGAAETPLHYAKRAEAQLGTPLSEAANAFSAMRYGRHAVSPAALRSAREAYLSLYERLNAGQKLLLSLRRALKFKK